LTPQRSSQELPGGTKKHRIDPVPEDLGDRNVRGPEQVLAGLGRVMARGWRVDPPETVEKAKDEWLIEANPLPAFIKARCEPMGACWLSDLYNEFLSWASSNGITRPQQKGTFKRNLQSSGYAVVHGNKGDKVQGLKPR
jgi:phage/plasmid-associated DNA primase